MRDLLCLILAELRPVQTAHDRFAADPEIDELADHGEDGDLDVFALGVLAGRRRPEAAEKLMNRLEYAMVDDVERRRRVLQLTQDETEILQEPRDKQEIWEVKESGFN